MEGVGGAAHNGLIPSGAAGRALVPLDAGALLGWPANGLMVLQVRRDTRDPRGRANVGKYSRRRCGSRSKTGAWALVELARWGWDQHSPGICAS